MIRLIKIETIKLLHSKSFRVLYGIYLGIFMLLFISLPKLRFFMKIVSSLDKGNFSPLAFPSIWITCVFLAQFFTVLLGIIMAVLVVQEFTFRTARQNIIDGLSRAEVVLGKVIVIIILAVVSTLVITIIGFFVGRLNSPEGVATVGLGVSIKYLLVSAK